MNIMVINIKLLNFSSKLLFQHGISIRVKFVNYSDFVWPSNSPYSLRNCLFSVCEGINHVCARISCWLIYNFLSFSSNEIFQHGISISVKFVNYSDLVWPSNSSYSLRNLLFPVCECINHVWSWISWWFIYNFLSFSSNEIFLHGISISVKFEKVTFWLN